MFWKRSFIAVVFVLVICVSGCSHTPQKDKTVVDTVSKVQASVQNDEEETEKIIQIWRIMNVLTAS